MMFFCLPAFGATRLTAAFDPIKVEYGASSVIRGTVTGGKKPVAGATVTLSQIVPDPDHPGSNKLKPVGSTTTSSTGVYSFQVNATTMWPETFDYWVECEGSGKQVTLIVCKGIWVLSGDGTGTGTQAYSRNFPRYSGMIEYVGTKIEESDKKTEIIRWAMDTGEPIGLTGGFDLVSATQDCLGAGSGSQILTQKVEEIWTPDPGRFQKSPPSKVVLVERGTLSAITSANFGFDRDNRYGVLSAMGVADSSLLGSRTSSVSVPKGALLTETNNNSSNNEPPIKTVIPGEPVISRNYTGRGFGGSNAVGPGQGEAKFSLSASVLVNLERYVPKR